MKKRGEVIFTRAVSNSGYFPLNSYLMPIIYLLCVPLPLLLPWDRFLSHRSGSFLPPRIETEREGKLPKLPQKGLFLYRKLRGKEECRDMPKKGVSHLRVRDGRKRRPEIATLNLAPPPTTTTTKKLCAQTLSTIAKNRTIWPWHYFPLYHIRVQYKTVHQRQKNPRKEAHLGKKALSRRWLCNKVAQLCAVPKTFFPPKKRKETQNLSSLTHHATWNTTRKAAGTTRSSEPTAQRRRKAISPGMTKKGIQIGRRSTGE